jgi:hypothetical protein
MLKCWRAIIEFWKFKYKKGTTNTINLGPKSAAQVSRTIDYQKKTWYSKNDDD